MTAPQATIAGRPALADRDDAVALRGWSWGGWWTLYQLTLRQYLHGRRWMVMGLLFLVPAALAVVVRATAPNVPSQALEFLLAMMFIPQGLLPLTALLYASGMIQDEQEEQTLTYLLIRPIPKWALYLVKLAATLTTTIALATLLTSLTFAAIYVGADDAPDDVLTRCVKTAAIHSLGIGAYCSLFGVMSLVVKRVLVIGIVYTAAIEGLVANMPFGIRLATVIYYCRLIAYRVLDYHIPTPGGRVVDMAAEAWQLDVKRDPTLAEHPALGTCILVLLLASAAFALVGAWLCTRREFHVKTPEKG
jgi:ABC-2 type transport system permease protein